MSEFVANFAHEEDNLQAYKREEMDRLPSLTSPPPPPASTSMSNVATSLTASPLIHSANATKKNESVLSIELITWSKDQSLRIWDVNEPILKLVGFEGPELDRFNNRYLIDEKFQQRKFLNRQTSRRLSSKVIEATDAMTIGTVDSTDFGSQASTPLVLSVDKQRWNLQSNRKFKTGGDSWEQQPHLAQQAQPQMLPAGGQRHNSGPTFRKTSFNSSSNFVSPADLQQEFSLINVSNLKNLAIEEMNAVKRFCIIRARSPYNNFFYRIRIIFPNSYPNNIPPTFLFLDYSVIKEKKSSTEERGAEGEESTATMTTKMTAPSTNTSATSNKNQVKLDILLLETPPKSGPKEMKIWQESKADLLKILQNTAHMQVKRNRPCLEPCLRDFMAALDRRPNTMNSLNNLTANINMDTLYGSFHDVNIPFPRTCGARFCGPDLLVCFSRPSNLNLTASSGWHLQQQQQRSTIVSSTTDGKVSQTPTPRALSALSYYLNSNKKLPSNGGGSSGGSGTTGSNGDSLPKILPISVSSFYMTNRSGGGGGGATGGTSAMGVGGALGTGNVKIRHKTNKGKTYKLSGWKCRPVYVFNVGGLLPFNKFLAEHYV